MTSPALVAVPDDTTAPPDLAGQLDNLASVTRPKIGRRKTKTLTDARRLLRRNLPRIPRTREGISASGETYRYADLDTVERVVWPYLDAYGLDWTTLPTMNQAGKFVLAYRLEHIETGVALTGEYPIREGYPQDQGAALTYAQRYTLQAATGAIVEGEDNDCARAPKAPAAAKPAEAGRAARTKGLTVEQVNDWAGHILSDRNVIACVERKRWLRDGRRESVEWTPTAEVRDEYDLPDGPIRLEDLHAAVLERRQDERDRAAMAAVPDLPADPDDEPAPEPDDPFAQIAAALPHDTDPATTPTLVT